MIRAQKLSKVYPLYKRPQDRILELLPFMKRYAAPEQFWAVREVSFSVDAGEVLAIIGPNGSGKSTLLQLLCGIIRPTSGRIFRQGRVAALLELGAGFNPEFTGRENVLLNAEVMGVPRQQVAESMEQIERFAEIGEFFHRPVKEYSSGMYVRLAFASAIHASPEILVIDEALAVGDAIFANRCLRKLEELRDRKTTILFVSHDLGLVKRLATRAIFMLEGRIVCDSTPPEAVNRYVGYVLEREKSAAGKDSSRAGAGRFSFRHGDGRSRILSVALHDGSGSESSVFETGSRLRVTIRAEFLDDVEEPVVGLLIRNRLGIDVFGTNTRLEERKLGRFHRGGRLELSFEFDCLLTPQEYTLTVATQNWDGTSQDWIDDALSFAVTGPVSKAGVANFKTDIEWKAVVPAG